VPFAPVFSLSLLDSAGHVIVTDQETRLTAAGVASQTTLLGQTVLTLLNGRAVFGNISAGVDLALVGPSGGPYGEREILA
jgi:hypothetical protein